MAKLEKPRRFKDYTRVIAKLKKNAAVADLYCLSFKCTLLEIFDDFEYLEDFDCFCYYKKNWIFDTDFADFLNCITPFVKDVTIEY